jgi:hypothetical protein
MKVKNRKVTLHQITVPIGGRRLTVIHVTPKQLEKLNSIPSGEEIYLSARYCQLGGAFWVIRTTHGFQYMPNPYRASNGDIPLLEEMLK